MDQFEKNCGFILACNYANDLIEPLHSRCTKILFTVGQDEKQALMMAFLTRAENILKAEGTEYELPVVAEVIMKHFPDWRYVLNELQHAASKGKIDTGALARMNTNLGELLTFIKEQKFTDMRKWVNDNSYLDRRAFFTALFDQLPPKLTLSGAGQAIAYLHKYDSESSHVANFEISMTACLFHLMGILKGEWK
jgi:replication factor C small subunit